MTLIEHGERRVAFDHPALARLLPFDVGTFAASYWGREALFAPADAVPGGPAGFADLLSLAAVDSLISEHGLRTPFLRVAKDGQVVDPSRWTGSGGAGAEIADQVRDDALLRLFADGCSLVLQGLHRTHGPLIRFATTLTAELGHPVQVNAYVTPPQSRGFDAHYDVHDVFVLQIAGEKRWRISRPVVDAPLRTQPWTDYRPAVAARAAEDPFLEVVLRPGDVLYLPRGWLHSAEALGEVSCHVTVGIHTVTRYAVVEALAALSAASPQLRTSLPLGVDVSEPAALREEVAATLEALAIALRAVPVDQVAERLRSQVWPRSRAAPLAPLAQAELAITADLTTRVRLRPGLHARLVEDDDPAHVGLHLTGRRLTLPAATRDAVAALLRGATCTGLDLPDIDPADAVVLVRRLLREGVLVPAPSPPT